MTLRSLLRAGVPLFASVALGVGASSCSLNPQPMPPGESPSDSLGGKTPTLTEDAGTGLATVTDAGAFAVDAAALTPSGDAGAASPPGLGNNGDGSPSATEDAGDASDAATSDASDDAGDAGD